jgi:predicted DNA-binding protein
MSPKTTTTIRIDDELLKGMQSLEELEGVPVSEQVRRAIEKWLAEKGTNVKSATVARQRGGRPDPLAGSGPVYGLRAF